MGFAHEDEVLTPNMDAFAANSVYCENATSTFPLCSPLQAARLAHLVAVALSDVPPDIVQSTQLKFLKGWIARAAATRAATVADVSPAGRSRSVRLTPGTSSRRSNRSISGPEILPR